MTDWLSGKRALIVGAGSGIGRAVVDAFLVEGAKVAVLERDHDKCELLHEQLPGIPVVEGDAITRAANDRAVAAAVDAYGGVATLGDRVAIFDLRHGISATDADQVPTPFDAIFQA